MRRQKPGSPAPRLPSSNRHSTRSDLEAFDRMKFVRDILDEGLTGMVVIDASTLQRLGHILETASHHAARATR